jgi:hypothetical protein
VHFSNVALAFAMPVFNAGRIDAGIRAQSARADEALLVWQKAVLVAVQEVEDSLLVRAQEAERAAALSQHRRPPPPLAAARADRCSVKDRSTAGAARRAAIGAVQRTRPVGQPPSAGAGRRAALQGTRAAASRRPGPACHDFLAERTPQ